MSWLSRLSSKAVLVGLIGITSLVVAACDGDSLGTPFQVVTVEMTATGPGQLQGTDPDDGQVKVCTVDSIPPCDFNFADAGLGGTIVVTAVPDAGAVLQSWTQGCPGSTMLTCALSFNAGADDTLSAAATFVPNTLAITFSDNFNSGCGQWTVTGTGGTAGGTNSEACRSSGGINGGGYREMTHQFGMGSMSVEHTFTGNSLVVGRGSGETCAATVRFQEQRIITTAAFTGAAVGAWVWIKQDGVRFNGPAEAFTNTSWGNYDTGDLTATQFAPGLDLCPVTTSTLTFGIGRSNTTNGAIPITMVHGIDDWSVTIVPGPLPTP
jgi:hypothetical protein